MSRTAARTARPVADVALASPRPLRDVLGLADDGRHLPLQHSAGFTPIAPGCAPGPQLLAGPTELAKWIRVIVGAPVTMRLRYRLEDGGWSTVRKGKFVGRNVPTIRAAIEGCVVVGERIYLLDRSDVTERTSLADIEAAQRGIRALMGRVRLAAPQPAAVEILDAPGRVSAAITAPRQRRLAAAGVR